MVFTCLLLVAEWRSTTATRSEPEGRRTRLAAPERLPLQAARPAPPAGARGRRHLEGRHALLLAPLFHRLPGAPRARRVRRQPGVDVAAACVEINQCVGCTGEEPASPRHRAGVASMAWRATNKRAVKFDFHTGRQSAAPQR